MLINIITSTLFIRQKKHILPGFFTFTYLNKTNFDTRVMVPSLAACRIYGFFCIFVYVINNDD